MKVSERLGLRLTVSTTWLFILSCSVLFVPSFASAAGPCGPAAFSVGGFSAFFSNYDSALYGPDGLPEWHVQIYPDRANSFAPLKLSLSFYDDECNPGDVANYQEQFSQPASTTHIGIKFTSRTHFQVSDDDSHLVIFEKDIAAYPDYYSVGFTGSAFNGASTFTSRALKFVEPAHPPLLLNSEPTPTPCSGTTGGGYYFDGTYERAEYVDGLLRIHLRLNTPYNDGRPFSSRALTMDDSCAQTSSSNLHILATQFTPHVRYYSFRMTSPTHYELWDDENETKYDCTDCQGDIPDTTPFVRWFGSIDGGFSYIQTTPFPPTKSITPTCITNCFSNVLFLPGIESSRLYKPNGTGDEKLWEPGGNADVQDLYLNSDGSSVRADVYTKEGDVLDELAVPVLGVNVYKSFIGRMNNLKSGGTIADWEAVPYDWRLSLDDILSYGRDENGRIYYSGDSRATSTPYIVQELRRLAATSRTGKVTIVAHSNGGLVAKQLTTILGAEAGDLIDRMIFVAVPQAGTPIAVAAGLHGYDQALLYGALLSKNTARTFGQNAPMTYNLLPSSAYFDRVQDPVVTFDSALSSWIQKYGASITSSFGLHVFLTDSYGRTDAATGDTNTPIQMNNTLLSQAEVAHNSLDTWTPPAGVELIQIAGWGMPKTVSGVVYKKRGNGITYEAQTTIDGDGTVAVPSALLVSTSTPNVSDYWVNLQSFNKDSNYSTGFGLFPFLHKDILEVSVLIDFVSDIVSNKKQSITSYKYLSANTPVTSDHRLHFALHSPLTLDLYDNFGRHTGVSTTTGQVEEQIPGTYYAEFGETKQIFSDATTTTHIVMDGYASGTFTFNVEELSGNTLVASSTFQDIPTTPSTIVSLDVGPALPDLSPMRIDSNGDGITDALLVQKINDVVTQDTIPPEIRIGFSTTTQTMVFNATDNSGSATLTATTTFPVKKKNEKEYHGVATTTLTAKDDAGNTTALVYIENLPSPSKRDVISFVSIAYNGATTTLLNASVSYKWRLDTSNLYKLFATRILTPSTNLESHYRPKKNSTVIMTKPVDLDDTDTDDGVDTRPSKILAPGMVVPYLVTHIGNLIVNY